MHQELWGYKVEENIYLGVRERKSLNITACHCLTLYLVLVVRLLFIVL
jgi:hypothetical protein